jgi:hypothetical protein
VFTIAEEHFEDIGCAPENAQTLLGHIAKSNIDLLSSSSRVRLTNWSTIVFDSWMEHSFVDNASVGDARSVAD